MRAQVHFAGVNTRPIVAATQGRDILLSYADVLRSPVWWATSMRPALEAGRFGRVILDSGAFTVISVKGFTVDIEGYAAFAAAHQHLFDEVVNLDDIAGDVAVSAANLEALEAAGVKALPVFHQGESWEILEAMLARHGRIGVGFARKPGGRLMYPTKVNRAFLTAFFERVAGRASVHGFAMTQMAREGFAFDTVDSTTWLYEFRALGHRVQRDDLPGDIETPRYTGTHGTGGMLADLTAWYENPELMELALDSYAPPPVTDLVIDAAERAEWEDAIERCTLGQARTVFRRYGPERLNQKLEDMDRRKCAAADARYYAQAAQAA